MTRDYAADAAMQRALAFIRVNGAALEDAGARFDDLDEIIAELEEALGSVPAVAEDRDRLHTALEGLIAVTAGLARKGDLIDQLLASGAIAAANSALSKSGVPAVGGRRDA